MEKDEMSVKFMQLGDVLFLFFYLKWLILTIVVYSIHHMKIFPIQVNADIKR